MPIAGFGWPSTGRHQLCRRIGNRGRCGNTPMERTDRAHTMCPAPVDAIGISLRATNRAFKRFGEPHSRYNWPDGWLCGRPNLSSPIDSNLPALWRPNSGSVYSARTTIAITPPMKNREDTKSHDAEEAMATNPGRNEHGAGRCQESPQFHHSQEKIMTRSLSL